MAQSQTVKTSTGLSASTDQSAAQQENMLSYSCSLKPSLMAKEFVQNFHFACLTHIIYTSYNSDIQTAGLQQRCNQQKDSLLVNLSHVDILGNNPLFWSIEIMDLIYNPLLFINNDGFPHSE